MVSPQPKKKFSHEVFKGPIKVFAGGDHSFLVLNGQKSGPVDFRLSDHTKQILTLTLPKLAACEVFKDSDVDLMAYLETVFGSLACVNASFLLANNAHFGCNTKVSGVDLAKAEEAFTLVSRFENSSIKELIFSHLTDNIIKKMKVSPPDAEALRMFLILPLYHEMRNPRRHPELQGPFAEAFNNLSAHPQKIVTLWWEAQTTEYFEMLVDIFKSVIVYELMQPANPKISAECFYIEDLCTYVDIASDYINWLSDQTIAITRAATQMFTRLFTDPTFEYGRDSFLHLTVSRDHVVRDTMSQISSHDSSHLKKPLKFTRLFIDPTLTVSRDHVVRDTMSQISSHDSSHLKKPLKFTRLFIDPTLTVSRDHVVRDTMSQISSHARQLASEETAQSAIFGLAIYNSIIIYVPFPLVLYKKILGESVMLDDLSDLCPVFSLYFAVNTEVFDQVQTHALKPDGENTPVTHQNKHEYVELYVDFLLNKSVENQFKAFNQGFQKNTEVFDQVQTHALKPDGENTPVTHQYQHEYVELYVDFLLNNCSVIK
ncbi:putative E3 ubiquitin-protein ligase HERC4 [Operophtera brumata]|uniref:HECT-type E3 ubiquitin transferase n=1 Tax=Operophtera brumata TaxID=104452 RepID=A0A0L7KR26_OPEBR|nr:putative E3 ubiquitin-protein ligase HERC4 [Operophtera brumata]